MKYGKWWGGGTSPPIPPGAGAADRRRVGSCRSCARCCRSDRRSTVSILEMVPVLCIRVHILASQLAITSKSIKSLFWLFVSSSTASRPLHGFGLLSLFALCLIASTVYRLFEIIFPKISFFSRALKIMTSIQSPRYASASSCGGVGVGHSCRLFLGCSPSVQLLEPVRIRDTLPAAVGQLLGWAFLLDSLCGSPGIGSRRGAGAGIPPLVWWSCPAVLSEGRPVYSSGFGSGFSSCPRSDLGSAPRDLSPVPPWGECGGERGVNRFFRLIHPVL